MAIGQGVLKRLRFFVFLLLLGLAWTAFSFVQIAAESIPYQDATAAMVKLQAERIQYWKWSALLGIWVSLLGGFFRWKFRKRAQ